MSDDKKSAATVLVELATKRYTFGTSTDGEPYAVPVIGDPVPRLLRAGKRGLRAELARLYYEQHGKAAPQQALADALLVIEGMASTAEPEPLAQRVAQTDTAWWLDLGDDTGDAIRIDATGWKITRPPMKFRRTVLTSPLPHPVTGDVAELWTFAHVTKPDRPLLLAAMVSALIANMPHPIVALTGEQGTGKSTVARCVIDLLDPSPVPLRKPPRDAESWVTAASGSWAVAIDNLSAIPDWLSDTLCRASTGDGDVRRRLYTDAGLAVFAFRRCVFLTSIDLGALRGDLGDRALVIDLALITERARLRDADLATRWQAARPRILGGLLDLAAKVARALPIMSLPEAPRMADYACILAAVDQVCGTNGLDRYVNRAQSLAAEALQDDAFILAMPDKFDGTSAELLAAVRVADKPPKDWPANARAVTTRLKRQAPVMRKAGWTVKEAEDAHFKVTSWQITRPEKTRNPHTQGTQDTHDGATAGDAGVACQEYTPSLDGRYHARGDDDPEARARANGYRPDCPECERRRVFESPPCPEHARWHRDASAER